MPSAVVAAMKQHIDLESEIGGYAAADRESERLDAVYGSVARLLNAAPDEIALMENATIAWQMAFYALSFRAGDRILTAEAEYAANYVAFLQVARRTGAIIDIVPSDASGELDVHALERMIDDRVKLIAITWVPTNGGLVNPAAAIGKIARARGIPYLLDACWHGRPDAGRRRSNRLRHAIGHGAQIPARASRYRFSLRPQATAATA